MGSKKFNIFVLGLFVTLSVLSISSVLAPDTTTQPASWNDVTNAITKGIDGIQQAGSPIFNALLGQTATGGDLFTKILYMIIVTLIVMAVLGQVSLFTGKEWMQVLIGIVVGILGIRFIPEGMLSALALPSSALVAALVVGVPFFIFGAIITRFDNGLIRRAGWTLYAVMLIVLWLYNATNPWHWIYVLFAFGCIIAFSFDGTLQRFLGQAKAHRTEEGISSITRNTILGEIRNLESALAAASTPADVKKLTLAIARKKAALNAI